MRVVVGRNYCDLLVNITQLLSVLWLIFRKSCFCGKNDFMCQVVQFQVSIVFLCCLFCNRNQKHDFLNISGNQKITKTHNCSRLCNLGRWFCLVADEAIEDPPAVSRSGPEPKTPAQTTKVKQVARFSSLRLLMALQQRRSYQLL